jgi:hypothetical protein
MTSGLKAISRSHPQMLLKAEAYTVHYSRSLTLESYLLVHREVIHIHLIHILGTLGSYISHRLFSLFLPGE